MAASFDLLAFAYAHRGFWEASGAPENSLAAFRAAAAAGLGIEFDLRPASDGEIMVFHDPLLDRLTGESGVVELRTSAELAGFALEGTPERLPRFEDLLAIWPPDLPLLAEMKIDGTTDPAAFAARVGARLARWPGRGAAMSFSEVAVRALPPGLMRGQLVNACGRSGTELFHAVIDRALADGIDYLAIHHTDTALAADRLKGEGRPFVVWTIRNLDDLAAAQPFAPALIFENLRPELARPASSP